MRQRLVAGKVNGFKPKTRRNSNWHFHDTLGNACMQKDWGRSEKVRRLGQTCQLLRGAESRLARAVYLSDDEYGISQSEEGRVEIVKKEEARGKKRT